MITKGTALVHLGVFQYMEGGHCESRLSTLLCLGAIISPPFPCAKGASILVFLAIRYNGLQRCARLRVCVTNDPFTVVTVQGLYILIALQGVSIDVACSTTSAHVFGGVFGVFD